MCYYAITDFECGDWKWGNMMERCPRQHRIGETCGAKLTDHDHVTKAAGGCKPCQDIEVKQRRLTKVEDSIRRWTPEKDRFSASLEKARAERDELLEKIKGLHAKRTSVQFRNGTDPNGGPRSSMPARGDSFTFRTPGAGNAAPGQMVSAYPNIIVSQSGVLPSQQYGGPNDRFSPYSSGR